MGAGGRHVFCHPHQTSNITVGTLRGARKASDWLPADTQIPRGLQMLRGFDRHRGLPLTLHLERAAHLERGWHGPNDASRRRPTLLPTCLETASPVSGTLSTE
ncbi:uncharacterized protein LOC144617400 [Panthera onca]